MKFVALVFLIFTFILSGCVPAADPAVPTAPPAPDVDVNATVAAAVRLTDEAKDALQATIGAGVSATVAAIPSPTPVDTVTLSEEQLAEIVNAAVSGATEATYQAADQTAQIANDGTITAEEVADTTTYVTYSEEEIAQAMALAEEYLALYYELGEETIALLNAVEEDLSAMAASTEALAATLDEINQVVQQGIAVGEDSIAQLQAQADAAQAKADEAKAKAEGWSDMVRAEIEARGSQAEQILANDVAGSRREAIDQLTSYLDTLKGSLNDGKFSREELDQILQLGVNTSASLRGQGGPELNTLADRVDGLNHQAARGEMSQVKDGLGDLQGRIPRR
ncbi:MAG: hypothetical protein IH586_21070 [Anaerolineaceae bacterium]|nr:hypothetical protein [Anaerolineaceae bacterium]